MNCKCKVKVIKYALIKHEQMREKIFKINNKLIIST